MTATDSIEFRLKAFKASSSFTPGDPLSFSVLLDEEYRLPGKFDPDDYVQQLGVDLVDKNVLVVCPGNGGLCVEALKRGASTVVALEPRSVYDRSLNQISEFAHEVIGATFSRRGLNDKLVESFDVIFWSEGLDEVAHPKGLFKKVMNSLKYKGELFIEIAHGHHGVLPDSINSWRPSEDAFKETVSGFPRLRIVTELAGRDQVRKLYTVHCTEPPVEVLPGQDYQSTDDVEEFAQRISESSQKGAEAIEGFLAAKSADEKVAALEAALSSVTEQAETLKEAGLTPDAPRHVHVDLAKDGDRTAVSEESVHEFAERLQRTADIAKEEEPAKPKSAAHEAADKIRELLPTDKPVEDNLDSIYEGRTSTPKSKKRDNGGKKDQGGKSKS